MDFYATGLPLDIVEEYIDSETFEYKPPTEAEIHFENVTSQAWRNENDFPYYQLLCPTERCNKLLKIPWNYEAVEKRLDFEHYSIWKFGYAEKEFWAKCSACGFIATHETLQVAKFKNDMDALYRSDVPMPGTVLSLKGQPEKLKKASATHPMCYFPNLFIKSAVYFELLDATRQVPGAHKLPDLNDVKRVLEDGLKSAAKVTIAKLTNKLYPAERVAVRRMMSRYWYNSSFFALDLVGAIMRQGKSYEAALCLAQRWQV